MDLHYLKLFNTLAVEMNFSRAAELLFISQPALSAQMKKLEDELGLKLFDKVGRKNVLNENGKLLFEYTKRIFSIVEEAEQHLLSKNESIGGSIKIGGSNTPGTYILPKIIGEFKSLYPNVSINLHISNTDEISHLVLESKVDFAVNGGNMDYENNIYVEKLTEDRIILAVSPSSPLASGTLLKPADLSNTNFITHENNSQMYRLAKSIIKELDINANITMTFGSIEAIKQSVAVGLGISFIPLTAVFLELKLGIIKEIQIKGKSWQYPYNIIYNKNRYLSPAVIKLMDMVRANMKHGHSLT